MLFVVGLVRCSATDGGVQNKERNENGVRTENDDTERTIIGQPLAGSSVSYAHHNVHLFRGGIYMCIYILVL